MSRIAYVNGRYVNHRDAAVHVEDRGYQFADGVYEVCSVRNGVMIDLEPHLDRLERSLGELQIQEPMSRRALKSILHEMVQRNRLRNGVIYLQITRGVARRDFAFPAGISPSLVITARPANPIVGEDMATAGIKAITRPDIRWKRCDIKSVSLLPAVLAKQAARQQGAYEAWLVDEKGFVTEGSSSNAWIVDRNGVLVTRNLGNAILGGVTRKAVLELAQFHQIRVEERAFSVEDAKQAKEAFVTSASSYVMPVVEIDGIKINLGKPGDFAQRLRQLYLDYMADPEKYAANN